MAWPAVDPQLAGLGGKVTGTIRVRSAEGANGRHRGEVRKLLEGRSYRRRGIARALLMEAEDAARAEGKTLLTLDMPEGDPSIAFKRSAGDVEASCLPGWWRHAGGRFQPADSFNRLPGRKETR